MTSERLTHLDRVVTEGLKYKRIVDELGEIILKLYDHDVEIKKISFAYTGPSPTGGFGIDKGEITRLCMDLKPEELRIPADEWTAVMKQAIRDGLSELSARYTQKFEKLEETAMKPVKTNPCDTCLAKTNRNAAACVECPNKKNW